jgi:Protein of unknown function (DUF642)/PEP-CTERM motif
MRELVRRAAAYQKLTFTFLCTALLLGAPTAHANLLTNGSFETPTVTVGSFTTFATGSSLITGWTVTGPQGTNVAIVSGSFVQNGVAFQAFDGTQWLDLTGNGSNSTEGVSQAVATTPGHVYQLSYLIGNTTGGGSFGSTSTVNVSLNGVQTYNDTNSNASASSLNWQAFSHTFTSFGGASTILLFTNGDPGGDNSNGLENVVLLDLGPGSCERCAVPEPGSLMLFAVGLAGLRLALRGRKG